MCGRYYVDDDLAKEIERLVRQTQRELSLEKIRGDVYPAQRALVLSDQGEGLKAEALYWGFPGFQGKGVIFNARSETVLTKRMFRDSVETGRCVVPASGFYEWDRDKNKAAFFREDRPALYMAGFHGVLSGTDRFVILTTGANASVAEVHDRMPLVLEEEEIEAWAAPGQAFKGLLQKEPPPLSRKMDYEQQRLDLS